MVREIQNNCANSYSDIVATVLLKKSLVNLLVATEERNAGPLRPGERGSFGARWRPTRSELQPRAREGAWDTVVIGIQGIGESTELTEQLDVLMDDQGRAEITNNSARALKVAMIYWTGYDAAGRVVAFATHSPLSSPDYLEPGQIVQRTPDTGESVTSHGLSTGGYRVYVYSAKVDEPARWTAWAKGMAVE